MFVTLEPPSIEKLAAVPRLGAVAVELEIPDGLLTLEIYLSRLPFASCPGADESIKSSFSSCGCAVRLPPSAATVTVIAPVHCPVGTMNVGRGIT